MRAGRLVRGVSWFLPFLAQGCVFPPRPDIPPPREPVRWILVERRYGDLVDPPATGDGRVNPDALVLTFWPLYPEDLKWEVTIDPGEHYVEVIGCIPPGPARPGEIVTATVRVGKPKAGQRYRLSARPSQAEVRIVGESQAVVRGNETAVFRFTSSSCGRSGIAVMVQRMEEGLP